MPVQRNARLLVLVGPAADDGKPVWLNPSAASAWRRMVAAAARDGISLLPISGYRSVARQARLIRRKLTAGQAIADILQLIAAPGCSEHHTGRAIDIGSPDDCELDEDFAKAAEFHWLKKHAVRFGYRMSYPRKNAHGIGYEPWHWCWHR
ncbi:MAG: D-alanyl-D-alanine carboxypeptidase family protein [Opitutae bacterium]|nr:D-alanyl-D-alanine carboxypeptidase family protein [Opitutae bacterium]